MYREVEMDNLDVIQAECLRIISSLIDVSHNQFMWPRDQSVLEIPTLKNELLMMGIRDYIFGPAFSVTVNKHSDIHVDHAYSGWRWSLNIPISNADNTFITFYDCDETGSYDKVRGDDTGVSTGSGSYTTYDQSACRILARYESNKPAIIDTTIPHQFESFNEHPRIMLLLRLNKNFNNDILETIP